MNLPEYIIEVRQKDFACLGEELAEIVNCIKKSYKNCVWYASDVDTYGDNLKIEQFMNAYPKKIGSSDELITLAKGIDQFFSGVFLLMPIDNGDELESEYLTEDDEFKELGNAIAEIRAFDTTSYDIYSNDLSLLSVLSKTFNTEVLSKEACLKKWGRVKD